MKKTIAAFAVAAAMGMGSNAFAADIAQISSIGLNTSGIAAASGIAGNFANLNQTAFQVVGASEWSTSGWYGSESGADMTSMTMMSNEAVAVSGAAAQVDSWFGGTSSASLLNAQMFSF